MPFQIREAVAADIPAIVDTYFDSFTDEIFSRQVYPRECQSSMDYWTKTITEEFDEEHAVWLLATETDSATGNETIQGYLKWVAPHDVKWQDADEEGYPPEGNPELAVAYYKSIFAGHEKLMEGRPHWYLDMMGVRRTAQGKGLAKQMVDWGVERSDRDGVPCYVDAAGQSMSYYRRFGFEIQEKMRFVSPQGDVDVYFMVREPKAKGQ